MIFKGEVHNLLKNFHRSLSINVCPVESVETEGKRTHNPTVNKRGATW